MLLPEMRRLRVAFVDREANGFPSSALQKEFQLVDDRAPHVPSLELRIHHEEAKVGSPWLWVAIDEVHDGNKLIACKEPDEVLA